MDYDSHWTERLIQCVEVRPMLYDKTSKEYSDRSMNREKWTEVCREMFDNWDDLSSDEQTIKGREIQQRWRNLRTCFKRELNKQQQPEYSSSRRRKYIYFDSLSFLLPMMEDRETVSNNGSSITAKEELDEFDELKELDDNAFVVEEPQRPTLKRRRRNAASYEDPFLNAIDERNMEEIDEDKLFLLSLVPSFRRLTLDQKLDVKLGFLQILKRIKSSDSFDENFTS